MFTLFLIFLIHIVKVPAFPALVLCTLFSIQALSIYLILSLYLFKSCWRLVFIHLLILNFFSIISEIYPIIIWKPKQQKLLSVSYDLSKYAFDSAQLLQLFAKIQNNHLICMVEKNCKQKEENLKYHYYQWH